MLARGLGLSLILFSLPLGCGGSVMESGPNGTDGGAGTSGSGGSAGSGGTSIEAGVDAAGSGGSITDAGPYCFSTQDCASNEWCDLEPAPQGMCSSGGKAGMCRPRPNECPDYDECPGACACDGSWYCDACSAHAAGLSTTADDTWCTVPDAGVDNCDPGFCQDAVMSSCGDPDFMPMGAMSCTGSSGMQGFCCLPICGGMAGAGCPSGQYCEYPPSLGPACGTFDGIGVCQWASDTCDDDCPGVCGCDGQFYCNECGAHQAGTDISDSISCNGGTGFPSGLQGIWLIGWSGGMNHFSWVRFGGTSYGGTADFLAGEDLPANAPFWPCTGQGSWMVTAKPDTLQLDFPASCSMPMEVLTFESFGGAPSGYPPGAIMTATIESLTFPGSYLEGYKFPDSQCAADMSSCQNPFGY